MLRPDLLDRYDIERRIHERLFCFGSDADDESGGGGSNQVDTSNPNEMRAREQDIAFLEGSRRAIVEPQGGDPATALAAVTGIEPLLIEMAQSTTPAMRAANAAANERQFQDFIANEAMNARMASVTPEVGASLYRPGIVPAGEGSVAAGGTLARDSIMDDLLRQSKDLRRQVDAQLYRPGTVPFGKGSVAAGGDMDVPTVANFVVGAPNLPPSVVTGQNRENFDTTSGDIIAPPPSPAEVFRAQESNRAMGLDQRQAGFDAYQAMLNDAVAAAQSNIDSASEGLLGAPTRVMNQMFIDGLNTRIGNRDGAAYQAFLNDQNLFAPVYNQTGRLTGYRDQFGRLTGTDPIADLATGFNDESDETTPPVTNPLTGASRCPDGFIFDEGLQTCRRKTTAELAETGSGGSPAPMASGDASVVPQPGDIFYRRSILDDAPANLPQGFDFDAANRRFIQSYGVRPDNYRMPLSLTGFTRL